ncbi:MAG: hypothetical protein JWR63_2001 [Conexibacter sp.]|nr:hypothetical protein [Conexibacter sp.]
MTIIDDAQKLVEQAQREARQKIEARIAQLDREIAPLQDERDELEQALAQYGGKPQGGSQRRSSGARLTREQRHKQVLDAVKAKKDLSTAQLARELGISPNRATGLVRELREANMLADGQPLRLK